MSAQKEQPVCKPTAERLKVFSSLDMAVKAVSTLRRRVAKKSRKSGVAEIERARLTVLKWAQLAEFGDELDCLRQGKEIPQAGRLIKLHAFIHFSSVPRQYLGPKIR